MGLRNGRGLWDDVLTEGLMKKEYCLTTADAGGWKFCHAVLFSQSRKQKTESREAMRVATPGHWVGAPDPARPSCSAEMGSHTTGTQFHSAVWTTTVLTLC